MAQPRVFVSSTFYDLKYVRESLEQFISSLGFDPVLSERGAIPYDPEIALDESCYKEMESVDIYVLIIGGRYGTEVSETRGQEQKPSVDEYISITRKEYQSAVSAEIPVYVLVERAVHSELRTYEKNRDNDAVTYAHVDSKNIFRFIEEIASKPRNNPMYPFEKSADIESWLRLQWAGLFRDLLKRRSNHSQLTGLAAQILQLSELNTTLKNYMEKVITKVDPEEAKEIIGTEERRLEAARPKVLTNLTVGGLGLKLKRLVDIIAKDHTVSLNTPIHHDDRNVVVRILIVSDHVINNDQLQSYLTQAGLSSTAALLQVSRDVDLR